MRKALAREAAEKRGHYRDSPLLRTRLQVRKRNPQITQISQNKNEKRK